MNRLAIVLHAHLPYVRHDEPDRLEERWLFEAITETYIPLIWQLEQLPKEKTLTLSLSPPLLEMLADPLLQKRYLNYLKVAQALIRKERRYGFIETELLTFYEERYKQLEETFLSCNQNVVSLFAQYQDTVSFITTSATHAILPYMKTIEGIKAQIEAGLDCFTKHIGFRPNGFWTPECALDERVDEALASAGIQYTFVDEHALPSRKPAMSPNGVMLIPRNRQLSGAVWSSVDGYPGHEMYREFYRDVAYERTDQYIAPFIHPEGIRIDTGIKCWRVTGKNEEKQTYDRVEAMKQVQRDAIDFLEKVEQTTTNDAFETVPFDAELFGHWWFEGPEWVGMIVEDGLRRGMLTLPESFLDTDMQQLKDLPFTTWGRDGYGDVWLNEKNRYMYKPLHSMEMELVSLAKYKHPFSAVEKEMMQHWMLAASSDWAFILDGQTATTYAQKRFDDHVEAFYEVKKKKEKMEQLPFLTNSQLEIDCGYHQKIKARPVLLIIALEYPPIIFGGIAKHVQQMAYVLNDDDYEVHILTTTTHKPELVMDRSVYVHRIQPLQPKATSFAHWVSSFNLACVEAVEQFCLTQEVATIIAHDWTTAVAAAALKERLGVPMFGMIHGTLQERGKYADIKTGHTYEEGVLVREADHLFVCSKSVESEIQNQYDLLEEKTTVLYSGATDVKVVKKPSPHSFFIYASGRLVQEKGFEVLIKALSFLPKNTQCVIAGTGPELGYLTFLAERLNVDVTFLGFIQETERNKWFEVTDVVVVPSIYEPFGLTALEAMSAGLPVVASAVGGLNEMIIDQKTGYLYPASDERELAKRLNTIYGAREEASIVGQHAKLVVLNQFNWRQAGIIMKRKMSRWNKKQVNVEMFKM